MAGNIDFAFLNGDWLSQNQLDYPAGNTETTLPATGWLIQLPSWPPQNVEIR